MAKRFENSEDGGSAVDRFRERAANSGRDDTDDDDDGDDDGDDEGDEDDADEGGTTTSSEEDTVINTSPRKAKKNARRNDLLEETRRELAETRQQLAHLGGVVSATQRTAQRDDTDATVEDPFQAEIDEIEESTRLVWEALQNKPAAQRTQADIDKYKAKRKVNDEKVADLRVERSLARRGVQSGGGNGLAAARQAALEEEFSDVYSNPNAKAFAAATFTRLRAKGQPDSRATFDQAMAETRREFKLGGRSSAPPRDSTRRKLEGQRNGSGGGNGKSSDEGLTLRMNKTMKRMANARFSHIEDEEKRYTKFAQSPAGVKLARRIRDGEE